MKRAVRITLALTLVACGSKTNENGGNGSGTAGTSGDGAADEPTDKPPAPTLKGGGKGDCKPEYAPSPKRDPNPMCKVAGGTFTMGDDNERMAATVSPYLIDQFEVTAAQVAFYLNATKGKLACNTVWWSAACFHGITTSPDEANTHFVMKKDGHFVPVPGYEHHPFTGATRAAAEAYCAWAGKKLPTEAQWEFAARHDPATNKDLAYPWGDQLETTRVSSGQGTNRLTPVGTYDGTAGHGDGRSPWGLLDMSGNAPELVLGCVNDYHPCKGPCVDPPGEPARKNQDCLVLTRGGSSRDVELVATQPKLTTSNRAYDLSEGGFRCVR